MFIMTLIIVIDHSSKMRIISGDTLIASQLILAANDLKRMHIKVILQ